MSDGHAEELHIRARRSLPRAGQDPFPGLIDGHAIARPRRRNPACPRSRSLVTIDAADAL